MTLPLSSPDGLPLRAGVGLKPEHFREILAQPPCTGFFEVHAENYMGADGPPHRYLAAIRADYPLSLHGVGLSIGGDRPLDRLHLSRLRQLVDHYQPAAFSEHLAWSSHDAGFYDDLLPLPYTNATLARVAEHIDQLQTALGRQILLENPATYLAFAQSTWAETDFIAALAARTGCGLLLDVNNVQVAATNQQYEPHAYIAAFPLRHVREIHLAGHAREQDECGRPLLIDTHDRPVSAEVWALYARVVSLIGPCPTLIEWDADIPALPVLLAEAARADAHMQAAVARDAMHAAPTDTAAA